MVLHITATVETVLKSRGLGGKTATITFSIPPGTTPGIEGGTLTLQIADPAIVSHYEPGEVVTLNIGGQ
jgi:hypothetical protein